MGIPRSLIFVGAIILVIASLLATLAITSNDLPEIDVDQRALIIETVFPSCAGAVINCAEQEGGGLGINRLHLGNDCWSAAFVQCESCAKIISSFPGKWRSIPLEVCHWPISNWPTTPTHCWQKVG